MPNQSEKTVRHICGISGGKDSSAMAVYMRERVPEMEYFFCDTGAELPETYQYLDKLEVTLGKPIAKLNSKKGFESIMSRELRKFNSQVNTFEYKKKKNKKVC